MSRQEHFGHSFYLCQNCFFLFLVKKISPNNTKETIACHFHVLVTFHGISSSFDQIEQQVCIPAHTFPFAGCRSCAILSTNGIVQVNSKAQRHTLHTYTRRRKLLAIVNSHLTRKQITKAKKPSTNNLERYKTGTYNNYAIMVQLG